MRKTSLGLAAVFSIFNFAICGGYIYLKEWRRWKIAFWSLFALFIFATLFHEEGKFPVLLLPAVVVHIAICTWDCVRIAKRDNVMLELNVDELFKSRLVGEAIHHLRRDFKEDDYRMGRRFFHY